MSMEAKITMLLEEYGLDKKEIKVYICLVEKGELNAYTLAKITGIHRSTVYAILERLLLKGFISKIDKDNKTFYSALDINQTITKIKEKEALLLALTNEIEKISEEGISKVRVLESRESQKQFDYNLFNQITQGGIKEVCIMGGGPSGFLDPEQRSSEDFSSRLFLESLLKELKRKKTNKDVRIKVIWDEKFKESKLLKLFSELGENKFLKDLPTLTTTVIFGEYLAYLFTMNNTPQVIEIQNKLIAKENRAYFYYLWIKVH